MCDFPKTFLQEIVNWDSVGMKTRKMSKAPFKFDIVIHFDQQQKIDY